MQYAVPMLADDSLDSPFTTLEVQEVIERAKMKKAPGENRITFEFYKNCTMEYVAALTLEFNRIFLNADVPKSFKKALIFPIHKKGDHNDPSNYRGISFLNTSAKIFAALIFNRLNHWVRNINILSEFQAGFRKKYSTVDQIFTLLNIAEIYKRSHKKLYAFFVDFRAAFDSIPREALFYKLHTIGISNKIINILRALYENNIAYVWDGESLSDEFTTTMGVKQGCILSALLFILFINDITEAVRGGIEFNRERIPCLMFADDIVFLADTVEGMQLMMNRLRDYCQRWNLSVNLNKSKMMVFRSGGGRYSRSEQWTYNGEGVEIVREYKYLGVWISANLNMNKHLESKLSEAKRAISSVWGRCISNKYITHSSKQKLFHSTAASILLYGAQVWGYRSYDCVDKFLRYFLKRIFRLPSSSPNYMLHLETGTPPTFLNTLKMHFEYVVKVMEMDEHRIPRKVLTHIIRTRSGLVREWERLASDCGTNLSIVPEEHPSTLRAKLNSILEKTGHILYERYSNDAQSSQYRQIYSRLKYHLKESTYFLNCYSTEKISTIFKIRGELLDLNFIPHRPELPIMCSLCNMKVREDVFHFLGVCPILKEFRIRHFGVHPLDMDSTLSFLNGENGWDQLFSYVTNALRYRKCIIEGNF